jgi:hypothetical protein
VITSGPLFVAGRAAGGTSATIALYAAGAIKAASSLIAGTVLDVYGAAVSWNADGPDGNFVQNYYHHGSASGATQTWNEATDRFDFSHPVNVTSGPVSALGIRLNSKRVQVHESYTSVAAANARAYCYDSNSGSGGVWFYPTGQVDSPRILEVSFGCSAVSGIDVTITVSGEDAYGTSVTITGTVSESGGQPYALVAMSPSVPFAQIDSVYVGNDDDITSITVGVGSTNWFGWSNYPLTAATDIKFAKRNGRQVAVTKGATYNTTAFPTIANGDSIECTYQLP